MINLDSFCARYNKAPHLIGVFRTPKARVVKELVEKFEKEGVLTSPSGMTADIIAKWLLQSGQPLSLYYHQTLKVWVVKRITDAQIEALARE